MEYFDVHSSGSVYLHGLVWLEVDCVLIHHEPAQTIISIVGRKSDSGLTVINIPKERIYLESVITTVKLWCSYRTLDERVVNLVRRSTGLRSTMKLWRRQNTSNEKRKNKS